MSAIAEKSYTADELLSLPDGDRFELIDGQLLEKNMGALSALVANRIASRLEQYAEAHGDWGFSESASYRCFADDSERVRKPDASYIQRSRLPTVPEGFLTIPPDVAVEVISPSDVLYEVEAKVDEYLDAGVKLVWLINPSNRSVRVFQPNQRPIQLGPADDLTGSDVLPDFRCSVAELFPPRETTSKVTGSR